MKEAAIIMFLYIGCFFGTTLPTFVVQILIASGYTNNETDKLYPLLVLNALLFPLKGFCNVFVYLKPAYTRFYAANPNKSMCFVLHQA